MATFQYSIKKITLVYIHISISGIYYRSFGVIWKFVCVSFLLLLFSAWDLVDGLSTYNFGTLGSFTPFYKLPNTGKTRQKPWNCRWRILACTTFVFARKGYLHIQINSEHCIREGANLNCDVARLRQFNS